MDLFTMSNLSPARTGLPFVVWISPRGGAHHDVRVKVSRSPKAKPADFVSVAVCPEVRVVRGSLSPAELTQLKRWLKLNQGVLVAFWDGAIEYTEDVLRQIKKL